MKTPHPDPTEVEIAAACEQIRDRWSEAEHRKRMAWAISDAWTAHAVEFDDEELVTET